MRTNNTFTVNILDVKANNSLLATYTMTVNEIDKFNNDNRGYLVAVVTR